MPLAVEGAGRQDSANRPEQLFVRERRLWAALPAVRGNITTPAA
jgi:hypothetical protein